jgi:DNA-binding NarL/FixJ family response regulator
MVEPVVAVELSIGDPELAGRVYHALADLCGFEIAATDGRPKPAVLITDTTDNPAGDLDEALAVLVLAPAAEALAALRMGATAVLQPNASAPALRAAVRAAALGLTTLPGALRHYLVDGLGRHEIERYADAPTAALTVRELQVLRLLAEGGSNKTIARRLGITPHTAKFHVAAIAGKLGASGRTDAVAKAMRLGLVMV